MIKSLAQKLEQCEALLGTKDISEWEAKFLNDQIRKLRSNHGSTMWMSESQIEVLESIYDKHFA